MTAPAAVEPGATPAAAPESTPPAAPAQAAQPPTPPESAAPAEPAKANGPIPFERHQDILKNARTKTEAEVTERFQQQYGPHVELGRRISADPVGTVVGLIQELAAHPDHGNAVISALARTLGSRRQSQPAVEEQEPQPDLQTPDGTLVYSAPQLAKREQWMRKQIASELDQRLQPLQQREEQRVAQERQTQAERDASERVSKMIAPYKAMLPEFDKHKPALLEKVQGYLKEGHDAQTSMGLAVLSVINTNVMPARAAESQQQMVAQAVAKATGSTTPPGSAPSAPAKRPQSFAEGFAGLNV